MRNWHGNMVSRLLLCVVLIGASGCGRQSTQPAGPTVAFTYDAPFCGRSLIEKSIDGAVVAVDSMSSGATSRAFEVTPGDHVLGARQLRVANGATVTNYMWPDTTVSVKPGVALMRRLSLYCS